MDEVSGHHLVLCHSQDALHHSNMSSCSLSFPAHALVPRQKAQNLLDDNRLLSMLTCLTKQMKHQSKQHLEDGQISDEVQKGSRDVEKAAGKQSCAADLMQGR